MSLLRTLMAPIGRPENITGINPIFRRPEPIVPPGPTIRPRPRPMPLPMVPPSGLPQLPSYTVATLPSTVAGDLALCTDETGGATVVFYDGSNWRRMADRAVAS